MCSWSCFYIHCRRDNTTIHDMLAFGNHEQAAQCVDRVVLEGAGGPTFIWDLSIREDFVEQNPIGPDIGLEGVGAVVGSFRGRPLHRDFGAAAGGINIILKNNGRWVTRAGLLNTAAVLGALLGLWAGKGDSRGTAATWGNWVAWSDGRDHSIPPTNLEETGKSKISNFAGEFLSHQDISGCQVPVDNVLLLQVPHPIRHLAGDVEQVGGAQGLPFRTC